MYSQSCGHGNCNCATGEDAVSNGETVHASQPDLEIPVIELLGAGLAAEVPGHPAQLPRHASLTQLVAVVTRDALQAQALDEVLLE